jgi:hypothetical protein
VPVPDYQSLMALTMSVLADGGDHSVAELRAVLAEWLALTEDDLRARQRGWPTGDSGIRRGAAWCSGRPRNLHNYEPFYARGTTYAYRVAARVVGIGSSNR